MHMISVMIFIFSIRDFGHPDMKILAKSLLSCFSHYVMVLILGA